MLLPEAIRATLFYLFSMTHLSMTSVYKFPSISKLYQTKSSTGICLKSCIVDVYSQTIYVLYNFNKGYEIMSYLDYVITDSTVIIFLWQVLFYQHNLFSVQSALGHAASVALLYACFNVPVIMANIILISTICSMSGKILTIIKINNIVAEAKAQDSPVKKQEMLEKLSNNSQSSWLILIFTSSLKICIYLFLQTRAIDMKLFFHSSSGLLMNFIVWGLLYKHTPVAKKEE